MDILLNNGPWKVKGFWPYVPFLGRSMELGNELMGVTDWIDAHVPGGVHFDLLKAGLIEDPYFEQNSLKCEWVEHRWWMYKTTFSLDKTLTNRKLELIFKGVDYKAHFYLNRKKLGCHEGMYENVIFDVTGLIRFDEENELTILFEDAPKEMSQIGHTSMTRTQKSRFNYKWDFGTRLVNIGLWDDVLLRVTGKCAVEEMFIETDAEAGRGRIILHSSIKGEGPCSVKVDIDFHGERIISWKKEFLLQEGTGEINQCFDINDPYLWYPNGIGPQPLYNGVITVYDDTGLSDERKYDIGIRKLRYQQNEGSPEDSLPYTFMINDRPVYIKGVNLTPFDHLYGNVEKETYDKYVMLLKNANVNMVRIWGGGIIEKEYFYHLCDLHGIMIWQEFIQSSSGVDNVPSLDSGFLDLLKATAAQAVKEKRNHVSHTVWSGGNELTDEKGIPITYDHPNIKMLQDIVRKYDPDKLFLPSSASGPNSFLNIEKPGANHDVHGSWKYEGIERHYHVFNHSDSLFHSEFGVDGCSSLLGMRKILGDENFIIGNMKDNLTWRHHGEWWDTLARDEGIFGKFSSLEQFIKASQFIQAEGLRYAIESNRRRKFMNSGNIIWQFNEPWPNVSCTCLVEHDGTPKMAYYWVKEAYAPLHISLVYNKLFYPSSERFTGEIYFHNSLEEKEFTFQWEVLDAVGKVWETGKVQRKAAANRASKIQELSMQLPKMEKDLFFIRLKALDAHDGLCSQNLYTFSQLEEKIFAPLLHLNECRLEISRIPGGYRIKNTGNVVGLFIHGEEIGERKGIYIANNYISLFPGEEECFYIHSAVLENDGKKNETIVSWNGFNK